MAHEWIVVGVILIISLGAGILANRLGALGARGHVWRTCLLWAAYGAAGLISIDLLEFGAADGLSFVILFLAAVGAVGGALSGLLMSYVNRR